MTDAACLYPTCSKLVAWPQGRPGRPPNFCGSAHTAAFRSERAELQIEVDYMQSRPAPATTVAGRQHRTRTAQLRWQLLRYPDPGSLDAALS